jgi:hypothetical protein
MENRELTDHLRRGEHCGKKTGFSKNSKTHSNSNIAPQNLSKDWTFKYPGFKNKKPMVEFRGLNITLHEYCLTTQFRIIIKHPV